MKIVKMKSLGVRRVFSPEMKAAHHNYITNNSGAVHKNSHAVAYCLVAYRCLWLKAHYAPEWWAAVMSDCHPDKLVRYMGVAKSEGVHFDTLNIDGLTINFTVTGDDVNQGLIGLKKVGMAASKAFEARPEAGREYKDIDEFVADHPKNKVVLERLIRLGSFSHLPQHDNRYALWNWYLYKYSSGKEVSKLRADVRATLLERDGWTKERIAAERTRMIEDYKLRYPKRNKIPDSLQNWIPKPAVDRDGFMKLFPNDYSTPELLTFEKSYLGYYMSNPLERYQYTPSFTIKRVKKDGVGPVHAVIMRVEFSETRKGDEMCRVNLYDGISDGLLLIWSDDCERYREILTKAQEALTREVKPSDEPGVPQEKPAPKHEVGVGVNVRYSSSKGQPKSFTLRKGGQAMWLLPPTKVRPTDANVC